MGTPAIVDRPERHYAAVSGRVTMTTVGQVADRLGEVFGWLAERGVEPAGAPFIRYLGVAMPGPLDVEGGVPVAVPVEGSGDIPDRPARRTGPGKVGDHPRIPARRLVGSFFAWPVVERHPCSSSG